MSIQKKFYKKIKGISVYLVSGASIRNKKETSFTIGSHWIVSKFIPKNQMWIDKNLKGLDRKALIMHELFEINKMKDGVSYNKAHLLATKFEKFYRETATKYKPKRKYFPKK